MLGLRQQWLHNGWPIASLNNACVHLLQMGDGFLRPTTHNKFVTELLAEWHKMLGNPAVLEQHSHIPWLNNSCTPAPRR
jgi:hypothetical protein